MRSGSACLSDLAPSGRAWVKSACSSLFLPRAVASRSCVREGQRQRQGMPRRVVGRGGRFRRSHRPLLQQGRASMRKEDLSPEDLAAMQSMYDHAVEDAKRDLADAISWQPLWGQLMTPGFRETLEACLDEVSFDRL